MTDKKTRTARPREIDEDGNPVPYSRVRKDNGPLHKLLVKCCPPDPVTGAQSITGLAAALTDDENTISRQALNAAIIRGSINPRLAVRIVDIADGRATLADFAPFYLL